jgi:hypothetical protein
MPDLEEMHLRNEERYADVWGLSSLIMGSFLALGAPVVLIFNVILWLAIPRAIPPQFTRLLFYIGIFAMVFVLVLCLLSLSFGVRALRSARYTGQPAGFGVAGILASVTALGAWLFVGIDLIMILGTYAQIRF